MARTGTRTSTEHSTETHQHDRSGDSSALMAAIPVPDPHSSKRSEEARFRLAAVILFVCILSFVLQTEMTKFVQSSMGYQKPYFIL
ncbi:hypothetical protein DFQ26_006162 [Actinomortierella ambigua]|nr:hypothetical protein DFQ26_006162 [Actinomortierella ambigua]